MIAEILHNVLKFHFIYRRCSLHFVRNIYEKAMDVESNQNTSSLIKNKIDTLKDMDTFYVDKIPYTKVNEGKAEVLFPSSNDVFYNPVQEFNRDMSVAVMKHHIKMIPKMDKCIYLKLQKKNIKKDFTVLEALSASGLRSIRYAKEVQGLTKVYANDISRQAFEAITRNVKHNQVEDIVVPINEDAVIHMHQNRKEFDVVDLDPYGTASPFLDAAVQSVVDGGLLMITCTDVAVLCGKGIEVCFAKYGAVAMKITSCHEMALRILLQSVESHANRYSRYIEPILSLSIDFYVRVFVRVFSGAKIANKSVSKLSMVYLCQGCGSFYFQKLGCETATEKGNKFTPGIGPPVDKQCSICSGSFKVGGPIWTANIHDKTFVRGLLEDIAGEETGYHTGKRMLGMLRVVEEELEDSPLFYSTEHLSRILHVSSPPLVTFKSAIMNAGYKVSTSHCSPTSIKTDAPNEVIWDVVREWAKKNLGSKTLEEKISRAIMEKETTVQISFEERPDANPESRNEGLCRFQVNPTPFWGPKARAKSSLFFESEKEKQMRFQGKRKKLDHSE